MISAILLAAGESRRMGELKQLLPFRGKTFVECCVDNLLASRVDEVVVVTGYRHREVGGAVANRPVRVVYNEDYEFGMSTSIKRGVASVSSEADACLIALVDQPQISSSTIDRLIEVYEDRHPLIVVPASNGKRGHPIILNLSLRREIEAMDVTQGLRQVVHAHPREVLQVELATEEVLFDCDYPEDYRRLFSDQ
ncbi:MAG TPA: molybdenum cofactor cytidylyltransferase [Blastocatellia bacterium]|nr:molybdenum cofactor cytidylyltransferase [Blastocatellia bacterium]